MYGSNLKGLNFVIVRLTEITDLNVQIQCLQRQKAKMSLLIICGEGNRAA